MDDKTRALVTDFGDRTIRQHMVVLRNKCGKEVDYTFKATAQILRDNGYGKDVDRILQIHFDITGVQL